jgi:hypothetical protein
MFYLFTWRLVRFNNWSMGHIRGLVQGRARAREGNKKLECGQCDHCTRVNIETLNWPEPYGKCNREE